MDREIDGSHDLLAAIDGAAPEKDSKQKKKKKKKKTGNNEEIANEADSKSSISKEANSGDMEQKPVAEMVQVLKPNTEK